MDVNFIFFIIILIMSVVIHEVSHGYAADLLGDPTPRLDGRLTLNPIVHLDLLGSFIVPTFMYMTTGFMFGWAKPVVYNPYNLRDQKWGTVLVGGAGVAANFLLALIFGLFIRFSAEIGIVSPAFIQISEVIVLVNLLLGVFNLIPIPPLDGSKVLFPILPYRYRHVEEFFTRNVFLVLLTILLFGGYIITPIIGFLFKLIVGTPFFF